MQATHQKFCPLFIPKLKVFYYLCALYINIGMNVIAKLQHTLQILEQSERTGALTLIEKDVVLNNLRDVYAEIKFGVDEIVSTEHVAAKVVAPVVEPTTEPTTEPSEEPEVEVELLFEEDEEDQDPVAEPTVAEPTVTEPTVAEPTVVEAAKAEPKSRHSAILSLYEDKAAPVVGELFGDTPSVADAIACPKAVAQAAPVKTLRNAIGVADKFMMIQELFDGNNEAYEQAIDALEAQTSLDNCLVYIAEHYTWRAQSQAAQLMMELLQRKFGENC